MATGLDERKAHRHLTRILIFVTAANATGPGMCRRVLHRVGLGLLWLAALLSLAVAVVIIDGWNAFGKQSRGDALARLERSPQWGDGHFENPQPLHNDYMGMLSLGSKYAVPGKTIPVAHGTAERFSAPPSSGLRITWLGHSTTLIEIDGQTILTDPVFGDRAGPLTWAGPQRWYPPPIPLAKLPKIDAVLISHDHYDHLDYPTIVRMLDWQTTFIVPLGVRTHLEYWGVDPARIVEVDWWEHTRIGTVDIACVPARHASGRHLLDQNHTLWSGFALLGEQHRVYFSGDTGLFPAMSEIGRRYGPFDVAMIEVGAYDRAWPDWHIGPEQAIQAHAMVRARVFFPVHWGLFDLAFHGWTEPIERTLVAAARANVVSVAPQPGQSIEPDRPPRLVRWWPDLPWDSAAEHPVISTGMN